MALCKYIFDKDAYRDAPRGRNIQIPCYCKSGTGGLEASIEAAGAKIAQLESGIEETDSSLKQLNSDVKKAKADRSEAEETMGKAKGIRTKEAQARAHSREREYSHLP
jgi:outer membrane murein-binding lipoprotein Lpp